MSNKIQIKRGLKSKLPILADGEFGLCTDTKEVFIGSGGANVDVTNRSQLAEMLNEASLSESGWFKDKKTGLILQWGTFFGTQTITFPIAFPNACLTAWTEGKVSFGTNPSYIVKCAAWSWNKAQLSCISYGIEEIGAQDVKAENAAYQRTVGYANLPQDSRWFSIGC